MPHHFRPCLLAMLLTMLVGALPASAHPEGFSGVRILVNPDNLRAVITLHTRDFSQWFPPRRYPNYVADVCREIEAQATAGDLLEVQLGDQPLTASHSKATSPEIGMIQVEVEYPAKTNGAGLLSLTS